MTALSFDQVQPGDLLGERAMGPITRTQLALFAGASGDHNSIHLDDEVARQGGLPGVIAHGMLSMAFLGALLTDIAPQRQLRGFNARFVGMAFPGDTITCRGELTGKDDSGAEKLLALKITAVNQDGRAIIDGSARIAVA